MAHPFILSCESTVDLPYETMHQRDIPVLFYTYMVDEQTYVDDMGRDPQALPQFYSFLAEGKLPVTSQINEFQYESYLDALAQQGDVLHIAFGSGMTASVFNAEKAAETLRARYPQRKIIVIDSLCSSCGYGMLVEFAADMRDHGASIVEVADWVTANRQRIHHQFFSTDLKYFRRSGRMSGPTAMLGAVLGICPIMHLDDGGHIIAYDKVRGKRNAIARTVDTMAENAEGGEGYMGRCIIAHSACPAEAEALRTAIQGRFPRIDGDIRIFDIGTIIASHCGPGTVAAFFLGGLRPFSRGGFAPFCAFQ